jgi:hypothetical protein
MKTYTYFFKYGQHKRGWYYSDRLSQLKGAYETKEDAAQASRCDVCRMCDSWKEGLIKHG